VADVRQAWLAFDAGFRPYLDGLGDAELGRTFTFIRPDGEKVSRRVGSVFVRVIMHSAQHRAELVMLATGLGHPPGELDLSVYLRSVSTEGNRLW
jgi:uncharacterized damage-inducible protein DinB